MSQCPLTFVILYGQKLGMLGHHKYVGPPKNIPYKPTDAASFFHPGLKILNICLSSYSNQYKCKELVGPTVRSFSIVPLRTHVVAAEVTQKDRSLNQPPAHQHRRRVVCILRWFATCGTLAQRGEEPKLMGEFKPSDTF
jgi:hypothetical protein